MGTKELSTEERVSAELSGLCAVRAERQYYLEDVSIVLQMRPTALGWRRETCGERYGNRRKNSN